MQTGGSMFESFNPNPAGKGVGDCTVRAMACAMDLDWDTAFWDLCWQGFLEKDMPSANAVWGAYLRRNGFRRHVIPDTCPDCYTVAQFAAEHPKGTYILALSGHVVCVKKGRIHDSWNSGNEVPLFYWERI